LARWRLPSPWRRSSWLSRRSTAWPATPGPQGRGRFFQRDEDLRAAQVAVIGAEVTETLFPSSDGLGGFVRVAGRRFEATGVQLRLGSSGGTSLDRFVWMSLTAFERIYGAPPGST
jgi:putative ABC transport system permease protein